MFLEPARTHTTQQRREIARVVIARTEHLSDYIAARKATCGDALRTQELAGHFDQRQATELATQIGELRVWIHTVHQRFGH